MALCGLNRCSKLCAYLGTYLTGRHLSSGCPFPVCPLHVPLETSWISPMIDDAEAPKHRFGPPSARTCAREIFPMRVASSVLDFYGLLLPGPGAIHACAPANRKPPHKLDPWTSKTPVPAYRSVRRAKSPAPLDSGRVHRQTPRAPGSSGRNGPTSGLARSNFH